MTEVPGGLVVIAMDGPSGTGKSTIARNLADRLDARYLDTGAMYRAATLYVLDNGVNPDDAAAVDTATEDLPLAIGCDPQHVVVELDGENVAQRIREDDVTANVSAVSAVAALRVRLVDAQRAIADDPEGGPIVVEGRDIGTVVFPDAAVKIYLTASAQARAERRHRQNTELGIASDYASVLAAVERRDHLDSTRKTSPLRAADDAIVVDSSEWEMEQTLARVTDLVTEAVGNQLGVRR